MVEKDEEYAELVYIIYKPVVDPIISYTVTVDVENADVTIDGEPYTGPVKVVAGTKITVAATAKPRLLLCCGPERRVHYYWRPDDQREGHRQRPHHHCEW